MGNCINIDPYSFTTNREGVFAAGDAVNSSSSVIKAIASGRKAAIALDRYLGGNGDIEERLAPQVEVNKNIGLREGFAFLERCQEACVPAIERIKSYCRVVRDMEENTAEGEARRCLQCDLRLKITPIKFWSQY
jgi:formate dehydrogenase beta subunit